MNKNALIKIIILFIIGGGFYIMSKRNALLIKEPGKNINDKPVTQSHRSYEMQLTSSAENISPNMPVKVTYKIKNDIGNTLSKFEVAHEKTMHLISIRTDLQHFQHIHPDYNINTNEFSTDLIFPTDGHYRLFADFVPGEENFMKLPVVGYTDIKVGTDFQRTPLEIDKNNKKTSYGYDITYLFPDAKQLKKENEVTYSLLIEKDGKVVNDLENYLGAKGHSVVIKEGSLAYIHTHALENKPSNTEGHSMEHQAMQKESQIAGNKIEFSTNFPEVGLYKIFTQFQHNGKVITTDYVIDVVE